MYSDPCARLMKFMMPHTSVRPAAIRKSISPSWVALSACSSRMPALIAGPGCQAPAGSLLHGALCRIRVPMLGKDLLAGAKPHLAVRVLGHRRDVVILD